MTLTSIVLILITVVLNTCAQVFLKLGAGQTWLNFYLLGGLTCYALSTVLYVAVLSKLNLSIAYPLIIGLTVIVTTLSSGVLLREKIPFSSLLGIGLMLSGISAIALGKIIK